MSARKTAEPKGRTGEFDLIARYFTPLAGLGAFGLGDDAAVLTPTSGCQMVYTADAIVSGVHFLPSDPAADVAAKLLAVNLSDLAAMGARGVGYLITTAWPRDLEETWIAGFAIGLGDAQASFDVALLGGDTVATTGPLCLSLTAIGEVPAGGALRRNGARPGDDIYVSGQIGDGGAGLRILRDNSAGGTESDRQRAVERYRRPTPRLALGSALRDLASACIDVSDGLVADLGHLSAQSSVCMVLDLVTVPVTPLSEMLGGAMGAIAAGDDYELLFTARPENKDRILAAARDADVPISRIGRVTEGQGVDILDAAGNSIVLPHGGYRHF
ncbi:MAG: thiamine-phosphate kinase [Rhodospirillaceae bacterium]|nr:thiamine-phosphate kinase [Rhodospirillaceae bacterium]